MNNNIKEQLQNLIDENSSKELIEKVAVLSNTVDELIAQSDKQKSEYTDLLKDYASLVKHSVYKVDNQTKVDEGKKEFTFEDFAQNWKAEK